MYVCCEDRGYMMYAGGKAMLMAAIPAWHWKVYGGVVVVINQSWVGRVVNSRSVSRGEGSGNWRRRQAQDFGGMR